MTDTQLAGTIEGGFVLLIMLVILVGYLGRRAYYSRFTCPNCNHSAFEHSYYSCTERKRVHVTERIGSVDMLVDRYERCTCNADRGDILSHHRNTKAGLVVKANEASDKYTPPPPPTHEMMRW